MYHEMSQLIFVEDLRLRRNASMVEYYVCYTFMFLKDHLNPQDEHIKKQKKKPQLHF